LRNTVDINTVLEKIVLIGPIGFNKLYDHLPNIKTARTLSKKLTKLESAGYIIWERKKHEKGKHKLEGRGHSSQIFVTDKTKQSFALEKKINEIVKNYFRENPDEKIKDEASEIILKKLGTTGKIKSMQILESLNQIKTVQNGIDDATSSEFIVFSKNQPYFIQLSQKESRDLIFEARESKLDFKDYCKVKLTTK
tara:strand:- start:314 stop:898 length:585 start_codon:yes stop_codon:yes gene_type:complete